MKRRYLINRTTKKESKPKRIKAGRTESDKTRTKTTQKKKNVTRNERPCERVGTEIY